MGARSPARAPEPENQIPATAAAVPHASSTNFRTQRPGMAIPPVSISRAADPLQLLESEALASAVLVVALLAAAFALRNGPLRGGIPGERWFFAVSGAVLLLALVSLFALRVGRHSAWLTSGVLLGLAFLAWRLGRRREAIRDPAAATGGGDEYLAALLVCFGALYAFYPNYFVLGGQDPGLYLLLAAHGAKTGGLDVDLPWAHAAWSESAGTLAAGYPGIYSLMADGLIEGQNRLSPQFMHLFPALASNAWAAAGLEAALRTNTLLAVLSLWGGFVLVRRFASWPAALVFVLVLGINPAFVWGARIMLTEVMALWLNLFGLLLLDLARRARSSVVAGTAGLVLGAGVLNRFDAGFAMLAVLGFSLLSAHERPLRSAARVAALGFLAASGLGFLDGKLSVPAYFFHMTVRHSLKEIIAISLSGAAFALVITFTPERWIERLRSRSRLFTIARIAGFCAIALWMLWVIAVRPFLGHSAPALIGRELTWYVTPLAWPLGLLGIGLALRARNLDAWLPTLTLTVGTLVVYTARTDVAHEHIWASRRWLPCVIPLLLLFSTTAAEFLVGKVPRRALRSASAVVLLAGYLYPALDYARTFLFHSMLAGVPAAYERFARYVHTADVKPPLVTQNVQLASILTFMYDVPTILLKKEGRDARANGDLAGRYGVGFGAFDLGGVLEYDERFSGKYLEITAEHRPRQLTDIRLPFDLGRLGGATFEVEVRAADPLFGTIVGKKTPDGALQSTARAGTLQNGPWIPLQPGQYEIDWLGRVWEPSKGPQSGSLDVITESGGRVLAQAPLRVGPGQGREVWLGGLEFSVERAVDQVEFRLQVEADAALAVTRVRLRRIAIPPADWTVKAAPPSGP